MLCESWMPPPKRRRPPTPSNPPPPPAPPPTSLHPTPPPPASAASRRQPCRLLNPRAYEQVLQRLSQLMDSTAPKKKKRGAKPRPTRVLVVLGPPGSGKRTATQLAARRLFKRVVTNPWDQDADLDADTVTACITAVARTTASTVCCMLQDPASFSRRERSGAEAAVHACPDNMVVVWATNDYNDVPDALRAAPRVTFYPPNANNILQCLRDARPGAAPYAKAVALANGDMRQALLAVDFPGVAMRDARVDAFSTTKRVLLNTAETRGTVPPCDMSVRHVHRNAYKFLPDVDSCARVMDAYADLDIGHWPNELHAAMQHGLHNSMQRCIRRNPTTLSAADIVWRGAPPRPTPVLHKVRAALRMAGHDVGHDARRDEADVIDLLIRQQKHPSRWLRELGLSAAEVRAIQWQE